MTQDPVRAALASLERPSTPRPEFREELFERLVREVGSGHGVSSGARARRGLTVATTVVGWGTVAATVLALLGGLYLVARDRGSDRSATIGEGRASFAGLPPFRAVVRSRLPAEEISEQHPRYTGGDGLLVHEVGYSEGAWRRELIGQEPSAFPVAPGLGSFMVWDGRRLGEYSAETNTFSFLPTEAGFDPADDLSFYDPDGRWIATCPDAEATAYGTLLDRAAAEVVCGGDDLWIDLETGIVLRRASPEGYEQVTELELHPSFADGTFLAVPPDGARGPTEPPDEVIPLGLSPGVEAPAWTGELLGGGSFELESLRGRPALMFLWADWCDDACFGRFADYERLIQAWSGRAGFVSVDYLGTPAEAEQAMQREGAGFAVVVDEDDAIGSLWGIRAVPTWVVLDARGVVVAVRVGAQSYEQLDALLQEAAAGT